ncbi:Ankyrin-1 [Daldinia childiae]|uniref:Ankyrin-1 n=1 Tax=Daldinia childiae TaxID=326645 RepID=UPI001445223A|nr:Ankyrin-1 [Daldinia childiae]KAF3067231.1 Ankyrin-1 [Daldinia childiae]
MVELMVNTSTEEFSSLKQSHTSLFNLVNRILSAVQKKSEGDPLSWLSREEYNTQYNDYISRRQNGTGNWMIESPAFRCWLVDNTSKPILFCHGPPGAGKSVLMATVIDYLRTRFRGNQKVSVAHMYCDFRLKHKPEYLLASLGRQLAKNQPSVPTAITQLYDECCERGIESPTAQDISKTLISLFALYSQVFVIIDALDECQENDGTRELFISQILQLQEISGFRLIATSRTNPHIVNRFNGPRCTKLEIRACENDVHAYLDANIGRLPTFVAQDPELSETIKAKIAASIDGMFLLARFHLDSLVGQRSPKTLRRVLDKIPPASEGYDRAYIDAMVRVEGQLPGQVELAKQTLAWVALAEKPLHEEELLTALTIEDGSPEFDKDNMPSIKDVLSYCAGLVAVIEDDKTVTLVHYTTQEYLQRTLSQWYEHANTYISKCCLTYLLYDSLADPFSSQEDINDRLRGYPLYKYSVTQWGHHARKAVKDSENAETWDLSNAWKEIYPLARRFLGSENRIQATSIIFQRSPHMTNLHLAAHFGLTAMIGELLTEGSDPNARDRFKFTPLYMAIDQGHLPVVRMLTDQGADIEARAYNDTTPLHWACSGDNPLSSNLTARRLAIIEFLLKKGANVHAQSNERRTPLHLAAKMGSLRMVHILLENSADLEARNANEETPIFVAVANRHADMVQMLLKRGAKASHATRKQTLLHYAVSRGEFAITEHLLNSGIKINAKNSDKHTALHLADIDLPILRLLVSRGANITARSYHGRTALERLPAMRIYVAKLELAASRFHQAEVNKLLEQGPPFSKDEINFPEDEDPSYRPELKACAIEAARFLFYQEIQLVRRYQLALWVAIKEGYEFAALQLLNKGVDVNIGSHRKIQRTVAFSGTKG